MPSPARRQILGVSIPVDGWWRPLPEGRQLPAGELAPEPLRVPVGTAQRMLRAGLRLVADLPAAAKPEVVWVHGVDELQVHLGEVGLSCAPGFVTVAVPVSCDQLAAAAPVQVQVPFAVGTQDAPAGLVAAAPARPSGPAVVVDRWAEAITAFAWEGLLHLAEQLSGAVGSDATGRRLVPGAIGAERRILLIQPIARHRLSLQGLRQ